MRRLGSKSLSRCGVSKRGQQVQTGLIVGSTRTGGQGTPALSTVLQTPAMPCGTGVSSRCLAGEQGIEQMIWKAGQRRRQQHVLQRLHLLLGGALALSVVESLFGRLAGWLG